MELNTVIEVVDPKGPRERAAWAAIQEAKTWFDASWRMSDPYAPLHDDYNSVWRSAPRTAPITDEDWQRPPTIRRGFTQDHLALMRRAGTFWIETGNLTPNLGPGNPGNQLMMKQLTRVFFGFLPTALPVMSPVGEVDISFNGTVTPALHLQYAHNGMDRLNLPRPVVAGPSKYDNETLVFERTAQGGKVLFELHLATAREARALRRSSDADGATFTMPPKQRAFGFLL